MRWSLMLSIAFHCFVALLTVANADAHSSVAKATANEGSPTTFLGFTLGADRKVATWDQIVNYFTYLDKISARVSVQTLGGTTQNRPLIAAWISSPDTIRDLAKYREIQRRLANPRGIYRDAEADPLIHEGRVVVAIFCSSHSTDIVASQMSMQLAFELATGQDAETKQILENTIILLVPSANPDAIDLVAGWYQKTLGTPFEGTLPPALDPRQNGDDLDSDWVFANLPETRILNRLLWGEWSPQIVLDLRQYGPAGPRFFIPPYYEPSNPHIAATLLHEAGL